jgi:hypothetical protein
VVRNGKQFLLHLWHSYISQYRNETTKRTHFFPDILFEPFFSFSVNVNVGILVANYLRMRNNSMRLWVIWVVLTLNTNNLGTSIKHKTPLQHRPTLMASSDKPKINYE